MRFGKYTFNLSKTAAIHQPVRSAQPEIIFFCSLRQCPTVPGSWEVTTYAKSNPKRNDHQRNRNPYEYALQNH